MKGIEGILILIVLVMVLFQQYWIVTLFVVLWTAKNIFVLVVSIIELIKATTIGAIVTFKAIFPILFNGLLSIIGIACLIWAIL